MFRGMTMGYSQCTSPRNLSQPTGSPSKHGAKEQHFCKHNNTKTLFPNHSEMLMEILRSTKLQSSNVQISKHSLPECKSQPKEQRAHLSRHPTRSSTARWHPVTITYKTINSTETSQCKTVVEGVSPACTMGEIQPVLLIRGTEDLY